MKGGARRCRPRPGEEGERVATKAAEELVGALEADVEERLERLRAEEAAERQLAEVEAEGERIVESAG